MHEPVSAKLSAKRILLDHTSCWLLMRFLTTLSFAWCVSHQLAHLLEKQKSPLVQPIATQQVKQLQNLYSLSGVIFRQI